MSRRCWEHREIYQLQSLWLSFKEDGMQKKWIGILVLVVFAFMLVGWDSGSKEIRGNQFDTGKVSKIVKGKTTMKECQAWFGKYTNKGIDSASSMEYMRWRYEETTSGGSGSKTTGKRYTLTIYFANDIVKNFNYEEEDITTKGGGGGGM